MAVVDNAVYVDGVRVAEPASLDTTFECLRELGGMAWIGVYRPDEAEVGSVATEFGIHPLAVEDTVRAHQRPKLERYGDVLFTVLRPAHYDDAEERVEFGELHVFTGTDFVVTVRHLDRPDLHRVRERLEGQPDLLRLGPEAVLYAVMDEVVDGYAPVVAGLQNDVDEVEDQLFGGDPAVSRRIYELLREVMAFQRAATPLLGMLDALDAGSGKYGVEDELRRYLRDVRDHVVRVVERVDAFRALLQNALSLNATIVAQRQNEEMRTMTHASLQQNEEVKRISAWAAIFFAPTLVGTVYGMNFEHMPELGWLLGYPFALALMAGGSFALYRVFRSRGWL
ncbi:magnesium and cobalt transport protein CorA [Cellulomonas carbonis]|uniref:Transporter n=1 Tax=Cellulomonas carbonis T26 TaxID=947969 RepID=A0A0A0BMW4_9CELL|nr:magnesium and cobalt transport protein CorA [Cellulomonas carbonis]KGM09286.1 transporter [Cellulomonas carbonis T26]GGB99307.1 magnesium transport protein CorA [Cellulomonas carbonis]